VAAKIYRRGPVSRPVSTPMSLRSSTVSLGSISVSIPLSRPENDGLVQGKRCYVKRMCKICQGKVLVDRLYIHCFRPRQGAF
jgi:hypothetical protein